MAQEPVEPITDLRGDGPILRVGIISSGNEADLMWQPNSGRLSGRYYNGAKRTEVTVSKQFEKLTAPKASEVMEAIDDLSDKISDGKAIGLLKDMVGKMKGLLPAPEENGE